MLNPRKALIVFSGGQDSTTCLFWAKQHFDEVYAVGFRYGQLHEIEVNYAADIAREAGVPYDILDVRFIGELSSACSLTNDHVEMDREQVGTTPPNTFVPGRNLFFMSIAAVYARERGIMNLVTGVSQTDFSGYPDCRDSFMRSLNVTLNLSMDEQFVIHTPLMWLNKCQTWELADQLGVFDLVRERTLTCYHGILGDGCGECPACKLRRRGLEEYLGQSRKKTIKIPTK